MNPQPHYHRWKGYEASQEKSVIAGPAVVLLSNEYTKVIFKQKTGTKSAVRYLKNPFPDVTAFDALVQSLIQKNPLGCTSL